jgi:hypothetical protein
VKSQDKLAFLGILYGSNQLVSSFFFSVIVADRDQLLKLIRCPGSVNKEGMPSDEVRGFDVFSETDPAPLEMIIPFVSAHILSGGSHRTFE